MTSNNVEYVSKRSFSLVSRMAPMLALLCDVLTMPLSGHTHTSVTSRNNVCYSVCFT